MNMLYRKWWLVCKLAYLQVGLMSSHERAVGTCIWTVAYSYVLFIRWMSTEAINKVIIFYHLQ